MTTIPAVLPDFTLGEPSIDHDHRIIRDLILALRDAVADGDTEAQGELGEALVRHIKTHFMVEELLMRLYKYPDAEAHVAEHQVVLDRLRRVTTDLRSGDAPASLRDLDALLAWRTAHIGQADAAYRDYLRNTGALRHLE
ncbi:MAG: hemerythrin [Rhodospirillales bacterium]|nr:MAG: hemerythrin [Rhodospirillales bacterium]